MSGKSAARSVKAASPASQQPAVLRRCACGKTGGECAACRKKRIELQRSPAARAVAAGQAAPPIVHDVLRSAGEPLQPDTRQFMESRLGHDFGRVRVHNNAQAAASAVAVEARAYTVGDHIVFGAGEYAPHSAIGQELLAHELAHVTQRTSSDASPQSGSIVVGAVDDPLEYAAESAARGIRNHGGRIDNRTGAARRGTLMRQPRKKFATPDEAILDELMNQPTAGDVKAAGARMERLRAIVGGVDTAEKAKTLHARLKSGDTLGKVFRSALSQAEQDDLLQILQQKFDTTEFETPTATATEQKTDADKQATQAKVAAQILSELSGGDALLKQAEGRLAAVASADLDPDLIQLVKEQAVDAREHMDLLIELVPLLASLPEEQRRVPIGAGAIELQLLIRNVEHLEVLKEVVGFEIPAEVTNAEEVEELLDDFANFHETWIEENDFVAELAGEVVDFATGVSEELEINVLVAELFADWQTRMQDQTNALVKIDQEMTNFNNQAKSIRTKSRIAAAAELIMSLRRGGVRGPKARPRARPKATKSPKAPKAKQQKPKKRKELRKPPKGAKRPATKRGRQRKDKKKKKKDERKKAYPICWPVQLGPPMLAGVPVPMFIRTPNAERDTQHAHQERLQLIYRERVDPGFVARDFHVHHSVPLFLGGLDAAPINLTLVPARMHLRGHNILTHQPQLARPIGGQAPPPGGANLYAHPAGTRYRLAGFKTQRDEVCVK